MIRIKIGRRDNFVSNIEVKGHSGYAEAGYDIVCAGASTMTITTVNAIMRYDAKAISYNQDEGFVSVQVKKHDAVIDLLLENYIALLKELEEQYKKYVKIDE